jgi:lipoprotein-anchoring transpeptidase ErfK/SrfK
MVNYTVPPTQGPGGPVFADVGPSRVATAIVASVPIYATPSAPTPWEHIPNPNQLGATVVFRVTGAVAGWWQVYLPQRPNEALGWVPTADVAVTTDPFHIIVSLGQRVLTLYRDSQVAFQTPIAPGAPSSPTPTGSFFVAFMVRLTDPGNVYGPYAFGTSAFSDTYFSFEGGPGQIGIHGTNQPWVIGSYASHGCIRLPNAAITTVAQQIVPGTAVDIGA